MYGYRARIGVMIPSANTVVENEFYRMAPEGVSIHTSRIFKINVDRENDLAMADSVERCAKELATAKCDTLLFACTSGSFVGGPEWEKGLVKKMEDCSGVKCLTTSGALRQALAQYGRKRISIVTPYIDELDELEGKFFGSMGYEVISTKGLGISDNVTIGKQPPEESYKLAKQIPKDTELLIISCTDFRSIENLEKLEKELGIPVISSNQASLWAALRLCGVKDKIEGYGSLFSY